MTLEQFAFLAEIIGVIVVAASVIFLAIQVRQNTMQIRVEGITKGIETQVHRLSHLTDDAVKADLVSPEKAANPRRTRSAFTASSVR